MTEREQAAALYTFLREFAQLRTRTIRDISSYERDGQVIWAADIPREPGCDCIAWHRDAPDAPDEVWLEMRKPRLTRPPKPPDVVSAWVQREQLDDSSRDFPELYATLPADSADDPPHRLEDHPEVQEAWDTYVEDRWWAWAAQDQREQDVDRIYTDLYSMFQRQQGLGENFEIVFGLGFLRWNDVDRTTVRRRHSHRVALEPPGTASAGIDVRRHLVAARVTIEFDALSGRLTVTPAGEGARPSLEQDMLDPQDRPDPQALGLIEDRLAENGRFRVGGWPARRLAQEMGALGLGAGGVQRVARSPGGVGLGPGCAPGAGAHPAPPDRALVHPRFRRDHRQMDGGKPVPQKACRGSSGFLRSKAAGASRARPAPVPAHTSFTSPCRRMMRSGRSWSV